MRAFTFPANNAGVLEMSGSWGLRLLLAIVSVEGMILLLVLLLLKMSGMLLLSLSVGTCPSRERRFRSHRATRWWLLLLLLLLALDTRRQGRM